MKKIPVLAWSMVMPVMLLAALSFIFQTVAAANDEPDDGITESFIEQTGPPWFGEFNAWNYRRPVTINITEPLTDPLTHYQILIKLDDSNYPFDADTDGSDVRFTDGSSTEKFSYWIESWDNTIPVAYIWVKVNTLTAGINTIYLYYGNPTASDESDGAATFVFFEDDWSQFASGGPGCAGSTWYCISPGANVAAGILKLENNEGISTRSPLQFKNKAVGYQAYYGSGNGLEMGGFINGGGGPRTIIRDLISDKHNLYLQNFNVSVYDNNLLQRFNGADWHDNFHVYEVRWWVDDQYPANNLSTADVDHNLSSSASMLASEVPTDPLSVTFNNADGSNAILLVNWVYVRNYQYPEPTIAIGDKQGLIDLEVTQAETSQPYAGEALTYQLTITNTSNIDAPGVILTDTLPTSVNFVSVTPSQGTCSNEIVCNLGTITANSTANITIQVTTTIDGDIINTAVAGSPSYEINLVNNSDMVVTTVLPSADLTTEVQDDPDPILPDSNLTYIITVTNQGPSNAAEVALVNTLPPEVEYKSSSPNICNAVGSVVTCQLNPLDAAVDSQIHINGKVKNITTKHVDFDTSVNSSTHDPNLANNGAQEDTFVDAGKPSVSWISPVNNVDDFYYTTGGMVTLEASAHDDQDLIDRLSFKYWDHLYDANGDGDPEGRYVEIGNPIYSPPYRVLFNPNVLKPNELYQTFAQAYDRAGNTERQRIFIVRTIRIFLPFLGK